MNKFSCLLTALLLGNGCFAQNLSKHDISLLNKKEDSIREQSVKIIQGINAADRLTADSIFTRMLVRALVTKHSFIYPFESLQTVSILYPPDSTFRIFTWQLVINENVIRQHGAIQMKTPDGSLKLFPLIDKSDVTTNVADTIGNNYGWIGAIYYKIIQKSTLNQNYYTLLGFDENNIRSSRKMIEVLKFQNGEPIFGGRYFNYNPDSTSKTPTSRFILEYKKEAGPRLTYDKDMDLIVVEHLISESNEPKKKWTLIGDGDYEGFKWENGKWIHINKVFMQVTPDGKPPVPNPLPDNHGIFEQAPTNNNQLQESKNNPEPKPIKKKKKG